MLSGGWPMPGLASASGKFLSSGNIVCTDLKLLLKVRCHTTVRQSLSVCCTDQPNGTLGSAGKIQ